MGVERDLLTWLSAREDEIAARLRELVEHETPTADKPALDAIVRRLTALFAEAGGAATIVPQAERGDHAVVRFAGAPSRRPALVLCHMDTVWPAGTLAARAYRIEGGCAWGPGTYDMKSGIAIAEYALRALRAAGLALPRPVTLLLNSDEEVGSTTSRPLIEEEARRSEYALVLESPLADGSLKTARKGVGRFTLRVTGRAVHAGVEPEKGVSAVEELARQVLALHALSDYGRGLSVNVGVVQGGNTPNQVAADARAEVDVRATTLEQAAAVETVIRGLRPSLPGAALEVSGGFNRPPMERTPAIAALFARAQEIGREIGLSLTEAATGGGSDGNLTAALGVPTLDGLGAEGDGAHAEHEYVRLDSLAPRAALLASLLLRL